MALAALIVSIVSLAIAALFAIRQERWRSREERDRKEGLELAAARRGLRRRRLAPMGSPPATAVRRVTSYALGRCYPPCYPRAENMPVCRGVRIPYGPWGYTSAAGRAGQTRLAAVASRQLVSFRRDALDPIFLSEQQRLDHYWLRSLESEGDKLNYNNVLRGELTPAEHRALEAGRTLFAR